MILGHATLEQATAHVAIGAEDHDSIPARGASGNGNGHIPIEGILDVIPSGPIPPDPGEFVSTAALARLLETLTERYDLVLVDAPPLLRVGDALTLAANVSALLVVTRLPGTRTADPQRAPTCARHLPRPPARLRRRRRILHRRLCAALLLRLRRQSAAARRPRGIGVGAGAREVSSSIPAGQSTRR